MAPKKVESREIGSSRCGISLLEICYTTNCIRVSKLVTNSKRGLIPRIFRFVGRDARHRSLFRHQSVVRNYIGCFRSMDFLFICFQNRLKIMDVRINVVFIHFLWSPVLTWLNVRTRDIFYRSDTKNSRRTICNLKFLNSLFHRLSLFSDHDTHNKKCLVVSGTSVDQKCISESVYLP